MSVNLIIKNTTIVTCDIDHTIINNGIIGVSGNQIAQIGSGAEFYTSLTNQHPDAIILNADGKILMPGLINMHAHCGDSLFRGLVENLPLEQWLQTVWKAQAVILKPAENCFLGAQLGICELLLGGTTTVMDNYWRPEQTFAAAREIGIRMATGGIFFDTPGMDGYEAHYRKAQADKLFAELGNDDEIFVGTMPHGTYTVGPENLRIAIETARENDGFFSTHAAETTVEQQTIAQRYDTSVIRHLNALGGLSPRTVLAHCVHVDAQEIDLLAQTGTHVAHNPLSNLKLASGFSPVPTMLEKGINVALGTDGPISGNDMDMWLAMKLAATIHKAANSDPSAISSHQALHMATLNGARALGALSTLGSIETGKRADFILIDISGPHAMPMFNPINHLVFSASKNDVSDVFVSGRHIVKDHELLTLDTKAMLARVSALQPQIISALAG